MKNLFAKMLIAGTLLLSASMATSQTVAFDQPGPYPPLPPSVLAR